MGELLASLRHPSVEAGVTGAPALFSDELSAGTRDGQMASVLALLLVSESATRAGHLSSLTIIAPPFLRRGPKPSGIQPGAT
jgi:hypothetical protein